MKKTIYLFSILIGIFLLLMSCENESEDETYQNNQIWLSIQDTAGNDLLSEIEVGEKNDVSPDLSIEGDYSAKSFPTFTVVDTRNKINPDSVNCLEPEQHFYRMLWSVYSYLESLEYKILVCDFQQPSSLNYVDNLAEVKVNLKSEKIFGDTSWHVLRATYSDAECYSCQIIDFDGSQNHLKVCFKLHQAQQLCIITLDPSTDE